MTALRISSGFTRVDRLPLFDKSLHPAEHPYPTVAVALRLFDIAGKSIVADFHERTGPGFFGSGMVQIVDPVCFQFPANHGFQRG